MCNNKIQIEDGREVACRQCQECKTERLKFWIGRNCAEAQTASDVWLVTLTYDGGYDNPHAYQLDYRDVQGLWKRLRAAGFRFSYFVAGEYGTAKARAHWHAMIYWHGPTPLARFDQDQYAWPHWQKGFSFIERPRSITGGAAYICKYLMKGTDSVVHHSENLGDEYLLDYARDRARHGVELFADNHPVYTVPNVGFTRVIEGKPYREAYRYTVRHGSSQFRRMVVAYIEEWQAKRHGQRVRMSEIVQAEVERLCNRWDVSPLVRDFIEFQTGELDPPSIPGRIRNQSFNVETTPVAGVMLVTDDHAAELRFVNIEGKETWRVSVDLEDVERARQGLLPLPPQVHWQSHALHAQIESLRRSSTRFAVDPRSGSSRLDRSIPRPPSCGPDPIRIVLPPQRRREAQRVDVIEP